MIKKILFLSANPGETQRLRLDKEVSEIEEGLQLCPHRKQFHIHSKWAVRFKDLRMALLMYKPHFVHFSGHGDQEGLKLESDMGIGVPVSSEVLSELFKLFSDHVECVILNACYSAPQAAAISRHIKYVIGMRKEIKNTAAIEFSRGFYDALGAGRSVEDAFKFGQIAILQAFPGLSEHLMPILKIREEETRKGPAIKPLPPPPHDLIAKGLDSLDAEEYTPAIEHFKKAVELEPDNKEAQVLYYLSFLSGKPILSINKSDMKEITMILKKIIQGEDQDSATLARILLGIIWFDYYLKTDEHYQTLFFKENVKYLMNYQPNFEEIQLINHIICSDSVKTLFRLRLKC